MTGMIIVTEAHPERIELDDAPSFLKKLIKKSREGENPLKIKELIEKAEEERSKKGYPIDYKEISQIVIKRIKDKFLPEEDYSDWESWQL